MGMSFDLQQELKDVKRIMKLRQIEEELRRRMDEEIGDYEYRQDDLRDISPIEYRKE
jgi:hypothetical protein